MAFLTLADIERAVRASWGKDTYPSDARSPWNSDNPARGQCGVVAAVLHDILGGDLMRGEVHVNGERVDYHWWNRLPGGLEIDLTRDQFSQEESITEGVAITRPPNAEMKRLRAEYELLRRRVFDALEPQEESRQEGGMTAAETS